ncbi:cation diffusion facilitator family transporter [Archaeoglobus fulgidus]|uniref:Conserved hypothetical transmembrane protein n=2 Tax=Archaeoglobus fulgidus TaxID=2234 RepID=O30282_ARCFU|nr:cation diffusion facilitator family transporter [Archaeoglobus fulgidus]AAB91271.1 conserved hypothetical transmembrane protein [Archaeoglobus fulgidus DSM 4304]KUJ94752.1 MAG: Conserved hypothetical transmembrane protein [Archaeoglobus fulgidus]KUK07191.1 MAG: Conserved hypothetical transmembrane protein [Archaeoglobus fulgidus]
MDEALRAGKISAFANVVLTALKVAAGIFANSTALIADGVHSLVDVLGSVLVWLGIKVAERPADASHPYGHFKAESLAEMAVGLIIILSSLLIMHEAISSVINASVPTFELYAVAVAMLSAVANELLARYKIRVGLKTRSTSLIAEGKHSRVDVLSSLAVVVGFFFVYFGYWWADSVVAIAISVVILQIGGSVLKNSIDVLMDRVDEELALKVRSVIEKIDGVKSVDFIGTRGTMKSRVVEVHLTVDAGMDAETIAALQREISEEIKERIPGVVNVVTVVNVTKPKVLAIPVDLYGHYTGELDSPRFVVVNLESGERMVVENEHYRAEKRKGYLISELLEKHGVSMVAVRKDGEGAKAHLKSRGILVKVIDSGLRDVEDVLMAVS